jgi:sugar phosphate isomerase/epimerase
VSNNIGRRELLEAGMLLPQALSAAPSGVPIGMVTNEFREFTNRDLAKEFASEHIRRIQLFFVQTDSNYWKYGSRSELPGLTTERMKEIAGAYQSAGISIHSLAVYTTLIHPDPAERKANLLFFERMMTVGAEMGVHTFLTEAGHYLPEGSASRIPYDYQDKVWTLTIETVKELARIADANGATVLLEPFYMGVFSTAKRMRRFLEEVGSQRIRVNLDPANLLEVNDLEEMFDQLAAWTSSMHAKDRKLHFTQGVPTGKGDLDYPKFVKLAAKRTPGVPMFIEYVDAKTYRPALAHLRAVMKEAGVRET